MNNQNISSKVNDGDEINLLYILYHIIALIRKNAIALIAIIFFSVGIGVFQFYRIEPYYKTRLIADSGILPNTEVVNIVTSWQELINKGDISILAVKLKLSENIVKKIKSIAAENTGTGKTEQLQDNKNENSFIIIATVTDVQILDSLQNAIVTAIESNEYVKRRSEIKKENLEALKRKITAEISDLDTVKQAVQNILDNGKTSGALITNPTEVNVRIIELYERILNLEMSIALSEDIQVIEGFTKTTRSDGPKLWSYLIYAFATGCMLAICFLAFKALNKTYKSYINSSVYNS